MSSGAHVAKTPTVPAQRDSVRLVKRYDRAPDRISLPTLTNGDSFKVELDYLRGELKAANDRVRRLREEVTETVKMLTLALEDCREESPDQVKRRISRLKGALEYPGSTKFTEER
jgi:hypothetical protein